MKAILNKLNQKLSVKKMISEITGDALSVAAGILISSYVKTIL